MTVTATPSAAPLTTKTSSRRRNSRFFSGAKKAMKALRSAWMTGGCTDGPAPKIVGRLNTTDDRQEEQAEHRIAVAVAEHLASVSMTGSTTAKAMPSRPNTSRPTVTRVRSL